LFRNKYGAQRVGGFGSKLEHAVYCLLKERERKGEISEILCQQVVVLQDGDRSRKISWRLDFSFIDKQSGNLCWAEAKGLETEAYKIKLKLFRGKPQGRLEIWKGSYARPYLDEVIE